MFNSLLKLKSNNIALFNKKKKVSYKNIFNKSKFLEEEFKEKKLAILICENVIGIYFYYLIFRILKVPIILLDIKTNLFEIKKTIKKYNPDFIVTNLKKKEELGINYVSLDNFENYHLFKNFKANKKKLNNKICLLIPTSGSMGSSKLAVLSYDNIEDNTKKISKYLNIKSKDKVSTNMSLSYSYMISIINSHVNVGASIYVTNESILTRDFWINFKKNKITSFNGVPYAYKILDQLNIKLAFNKYVKSFTQAGGDLEKEVKYRIINKCKKNKIKFFCMYGQTEAGPRISYLDPKLSLEKIGSIGKPLKGYRVEILNSKNEIIKKRNKIGRLILYGKNVFLGYANSLKDLTKNIKLKKKLVTGDYGYKDNNGFIYLTSRSGKIAKIFGYRIDILKLEYKMKKLGYIIFCKEKNGKLTVVFEAKYNKKNLLKKLSDITNLDQSGFIIKHLKKIPINKNQKIDRQKL